MPKKSFVITDTIQEGWKLMKANMKNLILVQLAGVLLFGLLGYGVGVLTDQPVMAQKVIGYVLQVFIELAVAMILIYIGLKVIDQHPLEVMDLIHPLKWLPKFFLATLLYLIVVVIGLLIFIIPGLIFAVRFGMYGYYIIDKGAGPIRSLELSWDTVKGASWRVLFMNILCQLINLAGLLCLVVGLFFTIPTVAIALALMYRKLSKQSFELKENN